MCMLLRIAGADFAVGLGAFGNYNTVEGSSISSGPGFETLMGHCVLSLSTTH